MKISERKESPILGLTGMGGGPTSYILFGGSGDSTYEISRSLRFNESDSPYLEKTFASAGNQTTFTFSTWIKLTDIGNGSQTIFNAGDNSSLGRCILEYDGTYDQFWFRSSVAGGTMSAAAYTDALFVDCSAWYHLVLSVDTTQSEPADRLKMYVNGVSQSFVTYSVPENGVCAINSASLHRIGRSVSSSSDYLNAYLADVHFVDGLALDHTSFGETDADYGVWNPKRYSGSYGQNGFHLTFDKTYNTNQLGIDANTSGNRYSTMMFGTRQGDDYYRNMFDGSTSTYSRSGNSGGTMTFIPETPISYAQDSGGVEVYFHAGTQMDRVRINGGTWFNQTDQAGGWTTVSTGNGTITSMDFQDNGNGAEAVVYGIRVNGTILTDTLGNDFDTFSLKASTFYGIEKAAQIGMTAGGTQTITFPINHTATETYEFFFRMGSDAAYNNIAQASTTNTNNWDIGTSGSNLLFGSFNGSWTTFTSTGLDDGEWHFVRLTTDGSNTSLYVDGVLNATNSSGGNASTGATINRLNTVTGGRYEVAHLRITHGGTLPTTDVPNPRDMNRAANSDGTLGFYDPLDDIASSGTKMSAGGPGYAVTITMNSQTINVGYDVNVDSSIDTPISVGIATTVNSRGNYCTMNPLHGNLSLSEGNLRVTGSGSWGQHCGTIGISSGKYYWEWENTGGVEHIVGVAPIDVQISGNLGAGPTHRNGSGWGGEAGTLYGYGNNSSWSAETWGRGDVIGVAFDATAGEMRFYKNGVASNGGAAAFTGLTQRPYLPIISLNGSSFHGQFNFGQKPFKYDPPTDYLSLCTENLVTPTITKPSEQVGIVTWTGNGGTKTIDGYDFSPNMVWIKERDGTNYHSLIDTIRGGTEVIFPSENIDRETQSGAITQFNSDGYNLGGWQAVNLDTKDFIGWAWNAGVSTSYDNNGSLQTTVSVNQDAGFSIAKYSYTGTGAQTVGHGLGVKPDVVWRKPIDLNEGWSVYSKTYNGNLGFSNRAYLDSDVIWTGTTTFNSAEPTDSVNNINNSNTGIYVDYSFKAIDGYSAFGTYQSTSLLPFVFTGFKARFVIIKRATGGANNWVIYDTERNKQNKTQNRIYVDLNDAAVNQSSHYIDIVSNGFKIQSDDGNLLNRYSSSHVYFYMAFAEHPLKYARAH